MNYYFLLEDEKSLLKVLPKWMEYLDSGITRAFDIAEMTENQYVIQSGQGVTQVITHGLFTTIDTIHEDYPGKIDHLVVLIDAEELEAEERKEMVLEAISKHYPGIQFSFEIHVFVVNRCFETWCLGCEGLFLVPIELASDFYESHYRYYQVDMLDPEQMTIPQADIEAYHSIADYHFHYLHDLLQYQSKKAKNRMIRYQKKKPEYVSTPEYLEGMKKRTLHTDAIPSFGAFLEFLEGMG